MPKGRGIRGVNVMEKKVTLTLLKDWHAAGVATALMALMYLSASFPWGKGVYAFIFLNSPVKVILGLVLLYLILKPIIRTPLIGLWFLMVTMRKNPLFQRLACSPNIVSKSDAEVKAQIRSIGIQYLTIAVFLVGTAFSMIFSVYIALGATIYEPFNYTVLVFGVYVVVKGILSQCLMHYPAVFGDKCVLQKLCGI